MMTGTSIRATRLAEDEIQCGSADFDSFVARLNEGHHCCVLGILEHECLIAMASPDGTLTLRFRGAQQRFTMTGIDRRAFTRSLVPLMVMPRAYGLLPR
jgi:hypothetical protein